MDSGITSWNMELATKLTFLRHCSSCMGDKSDSLEGFWMPDREHTPVREKSFKRCRFSQILKELMKVQKNGNY